MPADPDVDRLASMLSEQESCIAAEIRPGIHRPDWSVVTKPAAREALIGRDRARDGPSET